MKASLRKEYIKEKARYKKFYAEITRCRASLRRIASASAEAQAISHLADAVELLTSSNLKRRRYQTVAELNELVLAQSPYRKKRGVRGLGWLS